MTFERQLYKESKVRKARAARKKRRARAAERATGGEKRKTTRSSAARSSGAGRSTIKKSEGGKRASRPGRPAGSWLSPTVLLSHGSFFIWRTAVDKDCDDWKYTHGVYWPLAGDPGYVDKPAKQKLRLAIVMRCVRSTNWFATALPHRLLA